MNHLEFMQTLNHGDSVTYVGRTGWSAECLIVKTITVHKRTKTQMVCLDEKGREMRFRLDTGRLIGDSFVKFPMPATEDEIKEARDYAEKIKLVDFASRFKWESASLGDLRQIKNILDGKDGK